jgi:uncharacterized membrane protein
MLNLFRKKAADFFTAKEKEMITAGIKAAELNTSGEVRIFVESRCKFVNAVDRAEEIFAQLNMFQTEQRNAVLIYVALKDKQLAVFGDKGIHEKVGTAFWSEGVKQMIQFFNKENYAEGIASVATQIGDALAFHFPYNKLTDVNELPDDIVFGR